MKRMIAAAVMVALSGIATASENGFYFGINAGVTRTEMNEATIRDVENMISRYGLSGGVATEKQGNLLGAYLGFKSNKYIAFEVGYASLGESKVRLDATQSGTRYTNSVVRDVRSFHVDTLSLLPLSSQMSFFGKLGLAYTAVELDQTQGINGVTSNMTTRSNGVVPKLGIGIDYNLMKNIGIRLEYDKFFKVGNQERTGEADIDAAYVGLKINY